jgi:hypothetical protein
MSYKILKPGAEGNPTRQFIVVPINGYPGVICGRFDTWGSAHAMIRSITEDAADLASEPCCR